MTENGFLQIILYLLVVAILVKPLGWYMARVYEGKPCGLNTLFSPVERLIYRLADIIPQQEMSWKTYLSSLLWFNLFGLLAVYAIARLQFFLPLNPQAFAGMAPDLAFNTAASFITNTNWQAYGGENTLSYLTQMLALTVQNFLSAATGMALLVAFIRGLVRSETHSLGNFWTDMVRSTLYILLPLALVLALLLTSQGVIQNVKSYQTISLLQPLTYQETPTTAQTKPTTNTVTQQVLPMGPVASQIAIKQLGSNGGGFFNTNSAHPYENPTPVSNFLEMLAILLIPAAFCYTLGVMVNDKRQGWAILLAMFIMLTPMIFVSNYAEQSGNPAFKSLNINQTPIYNLYPGGNMEGKETRFGIVDSTIWATVTSATSNGSVNAMLDSFMPFGGLIPLWMMHLGEVVFGGVGSGLYGMLMVVIITVFMAGLMVGRTPEYLGKKIEPYEMKMASTAILLMPLVVLFLTGVGTVTAAGVNAIGNPGAHGFTEILYAFTSMGNNNGSSFAGLNANSPFYNIAGGIEMLMVRFWIAIPTLAVAGSLARKKIIPTSSGTLPTHTPFFIVLLIGVTVIIGALTFFAAIALGPVVEQLMLWGQYGH